jgi:hypothetical protein
MVGEYTLAGTPHGYLLSRGEFTTIDFPGATRTAVRGINAQGDVVGLYRTTGTDVCGATDNSCHGFVMSGGEFTSIDFADATETIAEGINPRGDIVGPYGLDGVVHGYLLRDDTFISIDFPDATESGPRGINPRGDLWDITTVPTVRLMAIC